MANSAIIERGMDNSVPLLNVRDTDYGYWQIATCDGEAYLECELGLEYHEWRLGRELGTEDMRALGRYVFDNYADVVPPFMPVVLPACDWGDVTVWLSWRLTADVFGRSATDVLNDLIGFIGAVENLLDPAVFGSPYVFDLDGRN